MKKRESKRDEDEDEEEKIDLIERLGDSDSFVHIVG